MTIEQKIKALAELDGYKCGSTIIPQTYPFCVYVREGESSGVFFNQFTYLTSYDAIIPLIQKQCDEIKRDFITEIKWFTRYTFELSPEQLADSLLKAVGKWEE